MGPDFYTFYSGKKKGKPDIILGNKLLNMFNKHISQGPRVGSDHIPIQIELDTKPILVLTNEPHLDYRNADWDLFKMKLSTVIPPMLDKHKPDDIDNAISHLFENINNATSECIPLKKVSKLKQNFNSPLTVKLIHNYQKYFTNQDNSPPQGLINITRQLIFENLLIDKDTFWKKIVKAASDCHGDHNAFWKKIKQLRGHDHTSIPFLMSNGKKITNTMEQTNVFAETWDNTFKITPNNNSNWLNLNKVRSWINNNKSKTSPYKKVNLTRHNNNNTHLFNKY